MPHLLSHRLLRLALLALVLVAVAAQPALAQEQEAETKQLSQEEELRESMLQRSQRSLFKITDEQTERTLDAEEEQYERAARELREDDRMKVQRALDTGARPKDPKSQRHTTDTYTTPCYTCIEAESGTPQGDETIWSIHNDREASDNQYMVVDERYNRLSYAPGKYPEWIQDKIVMSYDVAVDKHGYYALWARTQAPDWYSNSVWISVDGGAWREWHMPKSDSWKWSFFWGFFKLDAGEHTLRVAYRESHTKVDKFIFSNTLKWPSGMGEGMCPTGDCEGDATAPKIASEQVGKYLKVVVTDDTGLKSVNFPAKNNLKLISKDFPEGAKRATFIFDVENLKYEASISVAAQDKCGKAETQDDTWTPPTDPADGIIPQLGNPEAECAYFGMIPIAKYEFDEGGFEFGGNLISFTGGAPNVDAGSWTSSVPVGAFLIKQAQEIAYWTFDPPIKAGSYDNPWRAYSHITFCGREDDKCLADTGVPTITSEQIGTLLKVTVTDDTGLESVDFPTLENLTPVSDNFAQGTKEAIFLFSIDDPELEASIAVDASDECGNTQHETVTFPPGDICLITDSKLSNPYATWFYRLEAGVNSTRLFQIMSGALTEDGDDALFTGIIKDKNDPSNGFAVKVDLTNKLTEPPAGSPKAPGGYTPDYSDWYYYESFEGYLVGFGDYEGALLKVTPKGPAFQFGTGASLNDEDEFGASAWFNFQTLSQPKHGPELRHEGHGDFNIVVDCGDICEFDDAAPQIAFEQTGSLLKVTVTDDTGLTDVSFPTLDNLTPISNTFAPGATEAVYTFAVTDPEQNAAIDVTATDLCEKQAEAQEVYVPGEICLVIESDEQGNPYGAWFSRLEEGDGTSRRFTIDSGYLEETNGGADAVFTGIIRDKGDPTKGFVVVVDLVGKTTTPPAGSPKAPGGYTPDFSDWYYYASFTGVLTGFGPYEGAVLDITQRGPAFQFGTGGSLNDAAAFGASAWFDYVVTQQPTTGVYLKHEGHGDFNIIVDCKDICEFDAGPPVITYDFQEPNLLVTKISDDTGIASLSFETFGDRDLTVPATNLTCEALSDVFTPGDQMVTITCTIDDFTENAYVRTNATDLCGNSDGCPIDAAPPVISFQFDAGETDGPGFIETDAPLTLQHLEFFNVSGITNTGAIEDAFTPGVNRYDFTLVRTGSLTLGALVTNECLANILDPTVDDGDAADITGNRVGALSDLMQAHDKPETFALVGNYPNPFNPQTSIRFDVPEASEVRVVVYDALGRVVQSLVNGTVEAGRHTVQFNAQGLASGVYFYQMVTPSQTFTRQMILLQ